MFQLSDHWLLYPSDCSDTPLLSRLPSPHYTHHRTITPDLIVIHYTAGASARSTAEWCAQPESAVSYHVIIDRDGSLIQQVAFNRRAWHAGISSFRGHTDVNSFSVGIALANYGWLYAQGDPSTPTDYHTVTLPHKSRPDKVYTWECYPRAQLLTLTALVGVLLDNYPMIGIVGHDDVAPSRKLDPGPAFYPLPAFLDTHPAHPLFALYPPNFQRFQIPE